MSKNSVYSISQNFLTSRRTIERLIRIAKLDKSDAVLEIGAGKGHITRALAARCGSVISYEIDRALYERLAPTLGGNVRLYCRDFLRCELPRTPYKVFANIPFSRTTEIVRKLTGGASLPEGAWLIMENGAAKRFCGLPCESVSSLAIKPFFDARIVYHFRREDFHPAPRVDVVMLELRRKPSPDISRGERRKFAAFVERGLRFGVSALLTRRQVAAALRAAGLPQIERSANMLYVQWLCLFRFWRRLTSAGTE